MTTRMIQGFIEKGANFRRRFLALTQEDHYVTVGYALLALYVALIAARAYAFDTWLARLLFVYAVGLFAISAIFMGRTQLCLQFALGWNFLMLTAILDAGREFVHISSAWFLVLGAGFLGVSSLRYMLIGGLFAGAGILIVSMRALPTDPLWQHPFTFLNLLGVLCVLTLCGYILISARRKKEAELHRALEKANRVSYELRTANEELQASEWTKTRLLSTMSHELRTPMMAMQAASEMLQQADLSAPMQRNAVVVNRAASNAIHTLNDILLLREIGPEENNPTNNLFNLIELIEEVCRAVRFVAPGQARGVLDILPDMPAYFMGDKLRIRQVLHNVLRYVFSHSGSDLLRIRVRSLGAAQLRIEIRLWGDQIKKDEIGIALNSLDGGGQGQDTISRLGLSISRQFITHMNGRIDVNIRLADGVSFTLEIPCTPADSETIGEYLLAPDVQTGHFEASEIMLNAVQPWLDYWGIEGHRTPQGASPLDSRQGILTPKVLRQSFAFETEGSVEEEDVPAPLPKNALFSLLLIEDDPVLSEVIIGFFSEKGFQITSATSSSEAVGALTSGTFDVMISDVSIPGDLNGLDLIRFATGQADKTLVKCVLSGLRKHQKEALENGADGFFVKPASLEELHTFIRGKLRR